MTNPLTLSLIVVYGNGSPKLNHRSFNGVCGKIREPFLVDAQVVVSAITSIKFHNIIL